MEADHLNIWQILWDSGLVVKFVLLILVASSVVSWAVIFNKRKILNMFNKRNQEFLKLFRQSKNLSEVMSNSSQMEESPFKMIFAHGYLELMKIKEGVNNKPELMKTHFERFGFGVLERSLSSGYSEANKKLEDTLQTLASIGSVTPFIGLFGTVWGIIDSFKGLAGGGGTLDAVAPGIAEALVATAVGLAAAIPAVWAFNAFNTRVGNINAEMENFKQEFLNFVERSLMKG